MCALRLPLAPLEGIKLVLSGSTDSNNKIRFVSFEGDRQTDCLPNHLGFLLFKRVLWVLTGWRIDLRDALSGVSVYRKSFVEEVNSHCQCIEGYCPLLRKPIGFYRLITQIAVTPNFALYQFFEMVWSLKKTNFPKPTAKRPLCSVLHVTLNTVEKLFVISLLSSPLMSPHVQINDTVVERVRGKESKSGAVTRRQWEELNRESELWPTRRCVSVIFCSYRRLFM